MVDRQPLKFNVDFHQITDSIFLGPALLTIDIPILKELNIGAVLAFDQLGENIGCQFQAEDINYKYIPIIDFNLPKIADITETISYIDKILNQNKKLYIHCRGGIGRSNFMLITHFIMKGISPKIAASKVAFHRGMVGFSPMQELFFDLLQKWHDNGREGSIPFPSKKEIQATKDGLFFGQNFSETPYREINPRYYEDAKLFLE